MRILHVIRSVNPAGGGVIEAVKQVSLVHQEAGHTARILSLDSPDDPWVRECPVKVQAVGPALGKFGFTPNLAPWLRSQSEKFDAVIVNGIWQYQSYGVWRALRRAKTPYFVYPHGMLDPWFKRAYPLKHLKKWLYWPWSEYRVLRDARAVVFTCEEERLLARQSFWLYRCNEKVIELGVASPGGDPEMQKSAFFRHFPELFGKRIVLFLGRIHPKKGCDLLIKAFVALFHSTQAPATNGQSPHLVMAGPDEVGWLPELQRLATRLRIADRISWPGMLSGNTKLGALRAAEIFVLPSHQENFGIAVAESLSCGLPVLISNKVNIWREIEQDGAGIVAKDDEEGTAQSLRAWLSFGKEQRQEYRARARACFAARFEIHKAADSLVRVLQADRFEK